MVWIGPHRAEFNAGRPIDRTTMFKKKKKKPVEPVPLKPLQIERERDPLFIPQKSLVSPQNLLPSNPFGQTFSSDIPNSCSPGIPSDISPTSPGITSVPSGKPSDERSPRVPSDADSADPLVSLTSSYHGWPWATPLTTEIEGLRFGLEYAISHGYQEICVGTDTKNLITLRERADRGLSEGCRTLTDRCGWNSLLCLRLLRVLLVMEPGLTILLPHWSWNRN